MTRHPRPSKVYSDRMHLIVDGLCQVIALRASKTWAMAPLVLVLWSYLRRLALRFERLLARIDRGRAAPRRSPRSAPSRADRPRAKPRVRLPVAFAWLRWMAPDAGAFGTQLQALLAEPALAALLATAPQAGRMLRPLLHMLGQTAEALPPAPPRPSPRPVPQPASRPSPSRAALAASPDLAPPPGLSPKPA